MFGLVAIFFIAQSFIPSEAWSVAAQSGFNAVLVLILLGIRHFERRDDLAIREKDRKQVELLTRSVTDVILSMAFLPRQFHESAKDTIRALDAEHK